MAETKRIARGTDATLIAAGIALTAAAYLWHRYSTRPGYAPWFPPTLATTGLLLIATGVAIIAYAHRHR